MLPTIATGNVGSALAGEFEVANSLRFDQASNDYLNITLGTATNDKILTFSCWVKRSTDSANQQHMFFGSGGNADNNWFQIQFNASNQIQLSGYSTAWLKTNRLFRDQSAWYHVVVQADSTQATASDRLKLYVNGTQETSFGTDNRSSITQNQTWGINKAVGHSVGSENPGSYMDGYMCEVVFIDGSTLAPTSFGEFDEDTGIWKPIDVSGLTFGTNGFYLDFENSGSLGNDKSGNGNNFTVNNLTSDDQVIDTPTNNFATLNPLDNYWSNGTLSNGNLTFLSDTSNVTYIPSTIGVNSGKWYWEVEFDAKSGGSDSPVIGITSTQPTAGNQQLGYFPNDWGYSGYSPSFYINNNTETSYGSSYTTNDIIGVALDLDNNKLYFSKNGTWQNSGDPTSGATGTGALSITDPSSTPLGFYFPAICYYNVSNTGTFNANFGSSAFSYSVPSGYYSLNIKNLAEFG